MKALPEAALPWPGELACSLCFSAGFVVVVWVLFLDESCAMRSGSVFPDVASVLSPASTLLQ